MTQVTVMFADACHVRTETVVDHIVGGALP
jgi:hypothetical protein